MHWLYLSLAIVLEVAGTTSMKFADGFTRLWPSIGVAVFYLAALAMLTLALKRIDIGLAYAIWAGLGTAIIAAIGIVFFNEPNSWPKMLSIGLIIAGVVGLNLSASH